MAGSVADEVEAASIAAQVECGALDVLPAQGAPDNRAEIRS
jgi:hypothetical protein